MAKKESVQKRLEKVRPPRVQLTYDVEIGDSVEEKEIPFVTGVLGDFSGKADPSNPLPKLKDRKFVNVDLDNFDDVMSGMAPKANYRVKNKLDESGGEFAVKLDFKQLSDFRPEAVVMQVLNQAFRLGLTLADCRGPAQKIIGILAVKHQLRCDSNADR